MRRYPEYKESGVEWIGEIPSYWQTATIKHLTRNLDGKRIPLSGEVRADQKHIYPYYGANGVIDYVEDYIFEGEHILIGEDGAPFFDKTREVSLLASGKFWVNNHCHILKNIGTSEARFIVRCLNCVDYFEYITGSTRDKLTQADLNRIKIPIPSYQEQVQIADFLDRKTGQIDELVRIKERQIELLKEYRTSLINQTVTKGLDPDVEMKPSGVEWIGEIPKHWTMTRLKYLGESIIGLSYKPGDVTDNKNGTLVLRASNIQDGKPSFLDNVYVNIEVDEKLRLKEGDILICSRSGSRDLIGKNITITKKLEDLTFGVFMTVFRTKFFRFVSYFLNSEVFKNQSGLFLTATINQLTLDTLNNFLICFPTDAGEQAQIADFLDRKTGQIDELIPAEGRKVELLKEYRESLIFEAVTGKIDVRGDAVTESSAV